MTILMHGRQRDQVFQNLHILVAGVVQILGEGRDGLGTANVKLLARC